MKTFPIRAAQLDLARQMESVEFIFSFIDTISSNNYNAVFLYLEDRIITPSYQDPSPDEGYTCEQIREIVAYAGKHNLDVIPCVATLGHAERFLRFPRLQHLAEVRGETKDRFGGSLKDTFCVSQPEFYDFLFRYLREVAELFPYPYFHAGLDEFWNFNLCELCRERVKNFHDEELLFREHVIKVHDFLASIGKRMAMWPDMFENYQSILEDLPRDIIMTEWQYQRDVRNAQAHFNNLAEENSLAKYQKLGFEVWAAPADLLLNNGKSFLDYASHYRSAKGFLLTAWEKSDTFYDRTLPITAVCGQMAAGASEEEAFNRMMQNLFGCDDPLFAAAEKTILELEFARHFTTIAPAVLWSRSIFGINRFPTAATHCAKLILERFQNTLLRGREIIQDQLLSLAELIISAKINQTMMKQLDFGTNDADMQELENAFQHYLDIFRQREKDWEIRRCGITPNVFSMKLPEIETIFTDTKKHLLEGSFIRIRQMHSDWYGMPKLKISLRLNGSWHCVSSGVFKPENLESAEYEQFHPIDKKFLAADAVRLEHNGFGGLGVCYITLLLHGSPVKIPVSVMETENLVSAPEHLLDNDSKFCFFGNQSIYDTYVHPERANTIHRVDIKLADL